MQLALMQSQANKAKYVCKRCASFSRLKLVPMMLMKSTQTKMIEMQMIKTTLRKIDCSLIDKLVNESIIFEVFSSSVQTKSNRQRCTCYIQYIYYYNFSKMQS